MNIKIDMRVIEVNGSIIKGIVIENPEGLRPDMVVEVRYRNSLTKRSMNQNNYWHKCLRHALPYMRNLDPVADVESIDEMIKLLYAPTYITGNNGEEIAVPFRSSRASIADFARFIEFGKSKLEEFAGVDFTEFDSRYEEISEGKYREK